MPVSVRASDGVRFHPLEWRLEDGLVENAPVSGAGLYLRAHVAIAGWAKWIAWSKAPMAMDSCRRYFLRCFRNSGDTERTHVLPYRTSHFAVT